MYFTANKTVAGRVLTSAQEMMEGVAKRTLSPVYRAIDGIRALLGFLGSWCSALSSRRYAAMKKNVIHKQNTKGYFQGKG